MLTIEPLVYEGPSTEGKRKLAASERDCPMELLEVSHDHNPAWKDLQVTKSRRTLRFVRVITGLPGNNKRDVGVAGSDDAAAGKVSGRVLGLGDVGSLKVSAILGPISLSPTRPDPAKASHWYPIAECKGSWTQGTRETYRNGEENRPADNTDQEDRHDGDTAALLVVGERGEEQHEYEGDGIRGHGEKLGLKVSHGFF